MNQESGIHKRTDTRAFLIKVGPTRVKSTHAQSTVYSSFICKEIRGIISRSNANAANPTAPQAAGPRNTPPCRYTNPRNAGKFTSALEISNFREPVMTRTRTAAGTCLWTPPGVKSGKEVSPPLRDYLAHDTAAAGRTYPCSPGKRRLLACVE
jgi:hypothetical protein